MAPRPCSQGSRCRLAATPPALTHRLRLLLAPAEPDVAIIEPHLRRPSQGRLARWPMHGQHHRMHACAATAALTPAAAPRLQGLAAAAPGHGAACIAWPPSSHAGLPRQGCCCCCCKLRPHLPLPLHAPQLTPLLLPGAGPPPSLPRRPGHLPAPPPPGMLPPCHAGRRTKQLGTACRAVARATDQHHRAAIGLLLPFSLLSELSIDRACK